MLLSSVNFVTKPKTGKKDKSCKKEEKKTDEAVPFACEKCMKEVEEECRIFQFPATPSRLSATNSSSSGYASDDGLDFCRVVGDRVTIVTSDDRCLSVEQFCYTIVLKDESQSDNTCIFRKKVLETKPVPNGHIETVVFALDCDQQFFITCSQLGDLELNYFMEEPCTEKPDDRQFVVYHTEIGHGFIQPRLLKNCYLHHLDQDLSVQKLDLNYRCPEEYFFHFNAIPEPMPKKLDIVKVCTHKQELVKASKNEKDSHCLNNKTESESKVTLQTSNSCFNKLKSRVCLKDVGHIDRVLEKNSNEAKLPDFSAYKTKGKKSFISGLFFGCFGAKSERLTTSEV